MRHNVFERSLIQGRIRLRHISAEVYDPHVPRTTHNIQAICPWTHYVTVKPSIRIGRTREELLGQFGGDIEWTAFRCAHEPDTRILSKAEGFGNIERTCQIAVDRRSWQAIQRSSTI